jgi:hypothetical protein
MQSVLITPDSVGVKENNIIINKNNNDNNNNNKRKVHFSTTLDWSIEDTKIHRRKDWKNDCRIKKNKSSTTTGKRTRCTSHVVIMNNPLSSLRKDDDDVVVPSTFCPPRPMVVYTMMGNGNKYFIKQLLAWTKTHRDILRFVFDVCRST